MLREFTIEHEHLPAFRAALAAVGDELTIGAAEVGEMVFLGTKVFQQDYMAFCDNFAANTRYPPQAREEARRRREAIHPYLGKSIIHGGVSYNGFMLNVFIDKASSAVIHWESKQEPG